MILYLYFLHLVLNKSFISRLQMYTHLGLLKHILKKYQYFIIWYIKSMRRNEWIQNNNITIHLLVLRIIYRFKSTYSVVAFMWDHRLINYKLSPVVTFPVWETSPLTHFANPTQSSMWNNTVSSCVPWIGLNQIWLD